MAVRARGDAGETLVEIVIAILILGGVMTALLAGLATAASSSKSHRDLVTADTDLRSYAEAVKAAVRRDCVNGGTDYTVAFTSENGFTANWTDACPATTAPEPVHLTITLPSGALKSLDIYVRTP